VCYAPLAYIFTAAVDVAQYKLVEYEVGGQLSGCFF
jgi:hypothetical protein